MALTVADKLEVIVDSATRSYKNARAVTSPQEAYDKQIKTIKAKIHDTWQCLDQESNEQIRLKLRSDIVEDSGHLREFQLLHRASLADAEKAYNQRQNAIMKQLCDNLVAIFGETMVKNSLQGLSRLASLQEVSPETSMIHARAPVGDLTTSVDQGQLCMQHASAAGYDKDPSANDRAVGRRTLNDDTGSPRPGKRRRVDGNERSISFADVFQGGQAATKHIIVDYPNSKGIKSWYILRCPKHDLNFKMNPLIGAAAHLGGGQHGRMSRKPKVAIQYLGIKVSDCDEQRACENNAVAQAAFQNERIGVAAFAADTRPGRRAVGRSVDPVRRTRNQVKRRKPHKRRPSGHNQSRHDTNGISEPVAGEVYLAFWEKLKDWIPVLLLPTTDLDVGVLGTIQDYGLGDNVPACYDYNQRTKRFSWRDGYEDGGPFVSQREFPVMYFDNLAFPAKSTVGWVAATNLKLFDPNAGFSLITNLKIVRKFLHERKQKRLSASKVEALQNDVSSDRREIALPQHAEQQPEGQQPEGQQSEGQQPEGQQPEEEPNEPSGQQLEGAPIQYIPQGSEAPRLPDALSDSQSPSESPPDGIIDTGKQYSPVEDLQEADRNPGTTDHSTTEASQSHVSPTQPESVTSTPGANKDSTMPVEDPHSPEQHNTTSLPHQEATARAALRGLCGTLGSEPTPTASHQSLHRPTIVLPPLAAQLPPFNNQTPDIAQYSIGRLHRRFPLSRIHRRTDAHDLGTSSSSQSHCGPLKGFPRPGELPSTPSKCQLPPIFSHSPVPPPSTRSISTSVESEENPINLAVAQLRDGQFGTEPSSSVSCASGTAVAGPVQTPTSIPSVTQVSHKKTRIPKRIYYLLGKNANRYPHAPGSACFRNSQGVYVCPLCPSVNKFGSFDLWVSHVTTH